MTLLKLTNTIIIITILVMTTTLKAGNSSSKEDDEKTALIKPPENPYRQSTETSREKSVNNKPVSSKNKEKGKTLERKDSLEKKTGLPNRNYGTFFKTWQEIEQEKKEEFASYQGYGKKLKLHFR